MDITVGRSFNRGRMATTVKGKKAGYRYHFEHNDDVSVQQAQLVGWEIDTELKEGKKGDSETVRGDLILMRIPEKEFLELEREKINRTKNSESTLDQKVEEVNDNAKREYGKDAPQMWGKRKTGLDVKAEDLE